jgi:hypothetical protein
MRHRRALAVPPPTVVLELCRNLGLHVNDDLIRTPNPVRAETVLNKVELTVFDIFRTEGPLLEGSELKKRCLERGVYRSTYMNCLTYSPILARYARGVYGLRGARVLPDELERFRSRTRPARRSTGTTKCAWSTDGVARITYTVSPGMLNCGVVAIPASVSDTVGAGRWPLFTVDGTQVGELTSRRGLAWGWLRHLRRSGRGPGDVMVLEIDRATGTAKIVVGGTELLQRSERLWD